MKRYEDSTGKILYRLHAHVVAKAIAADTVEQFKQYVVRE